MINYFNSNALFSTDCSINYRLAIIKNITQFFNLEHMYYDDNTLSLYQTPQQLIDLFSDTITQHNIENNMLVEQNVCDYLERGDYILGLFDAYKYEKSSYYKKIHNYNTFIVYGKNNKSFLTYCNIGASGSVNASLTIEKLQHIFCNDLSKTNDAERNAALGFPLSVLSIKDNLGSPPKSMIEWLNTFYSNSNKKENFNIIQYLIDTRLHSVIQHDYSGKQYRNIANFKILKDMFLYHNLIIQEKYPSIIKNNNASAKLVDSLILIYAKYIHTFDNKYVDRMLFYLEKISEVVYENQRIIETL